MPGKALSWSAVAVLMSILPAGTAGTAAGGAAFAKDAEARGIANRSAAARTMRERKSLSMSVFSGMKWVRGKGRSDGAAGQRIFEWISNRREVKPDRSCILGAVFLTGYKSFS